ncbi:hypothetical protein BD410DRAFT_809755 [Rickenella mellea]|uniref:Uncharacterized protein n=1 Tax=Rickenella mellea TaxID=50990 RepID=A0A4Y7PJ07_9AGAM|nr:hypothetical protein BD410DRAFT_809755 [Rickenella mellea]
MTEDRRVELECSAWYNVRHEGWMHFNVEYFPIQKCGILTDSVNRATALTEKGQVWFVLAMIWNGDELDASKISSSYGERVEDASDKFQEKSPTVLNNSTLTDCNRDHAPQVNGALQPAIQNDLVTTDAAKDAAKDYSPLRRSTGTHRVWRSREMVELESPNLPMTNMTALKHEPHGLSTLRSELSARSSDKPRTLPEARSDSDYDTTKGTRWSGHL